MKKSRYSEKARSISLMYSMFFEDLTFKNLLSVYLFHIYAYERLLHVLVIVILVGRVSPVQAGKS